ncbi:MAG: 4Fe-4S dicluster domain-containing protein [archaeon]|jgi:NAD-dependent dihydropyrimidine dehydrogenase PreA subunit
MPVLINFKICDNASECNGAAICHTHAISWDEKNKTLVIDNSKCISCGKCVPTCMVDAIKVAKTQTKFEKIKKEFDKDKRKISDLFVDRYGAQALHRAFIINEAKFDIEVEKYPRLVVAELFNDQSIVCLYCSIPIKDLFPKMDIKYRKVAISDNFLLDKFGVKTLPALVFFNDGKFLGKVEGAFPPEKQSELSSLISKILKKK